MTKEQMLDRHFELMLDVAFASREIMRLQREIEKASAELESLDVEIDLVEAKQAGKIC